MKTPAAVLFGMLVLWLASLGVPWLEATDHPLVDAPVFIWLFGVPLVLSLSALAFHSSLRSGARSARAVVPAGLLVAGIAVALATAWPVVRWLAPLLLAALALWLLVRSWHEARPAIGATALAAALATAVWIALVLGSIWLASFERFSFRRPGHGAIPWYADRLLIVGPLYLTLTVLPALRVYSRLGRRSQR
jgi:hypothetical protein